jgi:hypothetical protein
MDHGSVKLQHTNGNVETMAVTVDSNLNSVTPRPLARQRQEDLTDVELDDGDVGEPYKTPVALQKKKKMMPAPVTNSESLEGEDSEVERKKQNVTEKKRNKGQRPVLDNATQVSDEIIDLVDNNSDINCCPNIETISASGNRSSGSVSCRFFPPRQLMFA